MSPEFDDNKDAYFEKKSKSIPWKGLVTSTQKAPTMQFKKKNPTKGKKRNHNTHFNVHICIFEKKEKQQQEQQKNHRTISNAKNVI